jgi:hypothetical protein
MCARLLLRYWPRVRYQLLLALLQQSLCLLPVAESTQTPTERAFGFADLPRGYTERWSASRCENVLGNQLRFGKRDFDRESFPHLGFQLVLDTSLARVRQEVTSVCRL